MSDPNIRKTFKKVKTARGRKISSTRWLQRQLNDPFVIKAKAMGYRSRAAFKLLEIHERFNIFKKNTKVVDLGAAPGSWMQVAKQFIKPSSKDENYIVGIDLLPIEPLENCIALEQDIYAEETFDLIQKHLNGKADVVMSDMAANSSGHAPTDHIRIIALCEEAYYFARDLLNKDGHFIAKILKGGAENELLTKIKADFQQVKHFKPKSSRADSAESYLVALNFKGDS